MVVQRANSGKRPQRVDVVIKIHSDGYIEVHGPNHVRAHIVNVPHGFDRPDTEIAVEKYVEQSLPLLARKMLLPGLIQAIGQYEPLLPSQIRQREVDVELLRAITTIEKKINRDAA